jgi:hypothetical protein
MYKKPLIVKGLWQEKKPKLKINMAQSPPKEFTYYLEDSKPILFDLYTPDSYSPSISTYKTLILYHSGGLVSANRRTNPGSCRKLSPAARDGFKTFAMMQSLLRTGYYRTTRILA